MGRFGRCGGRRIERMPSQLCACHLLKIFCYGRQITHLLLDLLSLPQLGDRQDLDLSPTNPAAFAHIGAEIQMHSAPLASHVTYPSITPLSIATSSSASPTLRGPTSPPPPYFPFNVVVEVRSAVKPDETLRSRALADWREALRKKLGDLVQEIPLLGRFLSHDTVFYWDQLNEIALGECQWLNQTEERKRVESGTRVGRV